jgi:hypothetical protein
MLGAFGDLPDLDRWRFMRRILEDLPVPPTQEGFWRCRRFDNFAWHGNCAWLSVRNTERDVVVETTAGSFAFDFIIFATGFETDLSARPELASIADDIALWRDRFVPPIGEQSELLARHPFLGAGFEFTERRPGGAPFLARLHNFTFGAMVSLGLTGAAIPGIKYGVRRLVQGLARDLFREDSAKYYEQLLSYATPELKTLETEFNWLSRLGSEAITSENLLHLLSEEVPDAIRSEPRPQHSNDQSNARISKPGRPEKRVRAEFEAQNVQARRHARRVKALGNPSNPGDKLSK